MDDGTSRQFVLLDLAVRPDPGQRISAESLKRVSVKRLAAAVCVGGYVKPGDGPMYPYEVPDAEKPETAREISWEDLAMTSEPPSDEPADKPRRGRPRRDRSVSRRAKVIYNHAIELKRTPRQAREEVIAQVQPDGVPVTEKTVRRWLDEAND
ncbi:hypothetical protein [Williamsia sp. 1135]|uniref:hypothetical protein n=1 Tax=Williamsia sp. 1135 TaxID=1889262 RepID=UPI000A108FB2|nr:hypothetical protein [Williamsia sp. 1135]ORM25189.1 hypothetical protein BFL43_26075 [Williamsia sp. 1135]